CESHLAERLRQGPALLAEWPRQAADMARLGARRSALDRPLGDPLTDRRKAEQAVDEVEFPAGDRGAAGMPEIVGDVIGLVGYAERVDIDPAKPVIERRVDPPAHRVVGEI